MWVQLESALCVLVRVTMLSKIVSKFPAPNARTVLMFLR